MKQIAVSLLLAANSALAAAANQNADYSCDRSEGEVTIDIPNNTFSFSMNVLLRSFLFVIYGTLLSWTVYNIVMYLILKQRYKEYSILLYYSFFTALFVTRLVQTSMQFRYINNDSIKSCIVAADGFSVCIGLSHVALIGELIISLQYFEAQTSLNDRYTITDKTQFSTQLETRAKNKKLALNIVVSTLIFSIIVEIVVRSIAAYRYPYIILNSQLIIIGICLFVETKVFGKLAKRVFEADFEDEQRFFNKSLVVFLSTYALRVILLVFIICFWCTYFNLFMDYPLLMATVQSSAHLVYDALPVVHVMMQHQRTFKNEEKGTTEVVMHCDPLDTTTTLNQTDNDFSRLMTLHCLQQMRLSSAAGHSDTTIVKRTIVHDDQEMLAQLMEDESSKSSSVNFSSKQTDGGVMDDGTEVTDDVFENSNPTTNDNKIAKSASNNPFSGASSSTSGMLRGSTDAKNSRSDQPEKKLKKMKIRQSDNSLDFHQLQSSPGQTTIMPSGVGSSQAGDSRRVTIGNRQDLMRISMAGLFQRKGL